MSCTRSGRKKSVTSYRDFLSNSDLSSPEKSIRKSTRKVQTSKNYRYSSPDDEIEHKTSPAKRKLFSSNITSNSDSDDLLSEKSRRKSTRQIKTPLKYKENYLQSPSKRKFNSLETDDLITVSFKTPTKPKSILQDDLPIKLTPKTRRKLDEIVENIVPLNLNSPQKIQTSETPSRSILKTKRTPHTKRVSLAINKKTISTTPIQTNSKLDIARQKLHVSAVPESLPCRENEYSDIYNFIYGKLSSDSSGCMYVAGVPGTGKTATVTEVIRNLQDLSLDDDPEVPSFDFIHINGMRLTEPRQAYVQIYKQLTGQTLVWDQAYECLKKKILSSTTRKRPIVLLVDELDIIHTKRQDVVYNILDWPSQLNSKLIIIAISNTMDLPERLLMGRVASRLGLTRLPFQPYNFKQLEQIVTSRLEGSNIFQNEAIQLVARKVAAVSGDARRALDICRRAAEIAAHSEISSSAPTTKTAEYRVTLKHVNQALSEMINSDQIKLIQNLSTIEKLFLQAIIAEVTRIGVEETSYQNVLRQFKTLCTINGVSEPACTLITIVAQNLAKQKMIVMEKSKYNNIEQLYLNISQDDVHFALRQIED